MAQQESGGSWVTPEEKKVIRKRQRRENMSQILRIVGKYGAIPAAVGLGVDQLHGNILGLSGGVLDAVSIAATEAIMYFAVPYAHGYTFKLPEGRMGRVTAIPGILARQYEKTPPLTNRLADIFASVRGVHITNWEADRRRQDREIKPFLRPIK